MTHTEWGKLFATHMYNNRQVSRTHKEPLQLNNKGQTVQLKKDLNTFLQRYTKG